MTNKTIKTNKTINYTQYKELYKLFYDISIYLDAPRYFTMWEINENIKCYINDLIHNGYSTISYLISELIECHDITNENIQLASQLKTAYRLFSM